jgi:hypothetical protein
MAVSCPCGERDEWIGPSPAPYGRSAWRLALLITDLLFATGRRIVSAWL